MSEILILAFETSCDETCAAVVRGGREVLSDIIYSQTTTHAEYGGVVPEIASRRHIEKINIVTEKALAEAGVTLADLDAVAVTYGPGLAGALIVGVSFAKALAFASDTPLIGVHHIEGHICANYIEHPGLRPPFACLVVSGGHSHIVAVRDYGSYEVLGRTRDDAAGEAYDKVARVLGLGYPGGPAIDATARTGNAQAIHFPRAQVDGSPYDFSFSGLKSAVLNHVNQARMREGDKGTGVLSPINIADMVQVDDVAASFQQAVVDVLAEHTLMAARDHGFDTLALAGGVAANSALRARMDADCAAAGIKLYCPSLNYCTDNAAMIGVAAQHDYVAGRFSGFDLNAVPGLKLGVSRGH